jgi:hypothetical protein
LHFWLSWSGNSSELFKSSLKIYAATTDINDVDGFSSRLLWAYATNGMKNNNMRITTTSQGTSISFNAIHFHAGQDKVDVESGNIDSPAQSSADGRNEPLRSGLIPITCGIFCGVSLRGAAGLALSVKPRRIKSSVVGIFDALPHYTDITAYSGTLVSSKGNLS